MKIEVDVLVPNKDVVEILKKGERDSKFLISARLP